MDKLCFILPIVGTMFKKVYYSEGKKRICSELLSPKNVVVNYYVKKLQNASRLTEVQWWTANEIKEKQLKAEWIDYGKDQEFGHGTISQADDGLAESATTGLTPPSPDEETPRKILVQYCRLDLDKDGYKEPYIVTVDEETQLVLSIKANFYAENVEFVDAAKKKVACITPAQWFVKYDFLPNPDGGFYGIGFGILLGGINDMVNTLTNQILDAGTISNLQAGFIGRGLRDNKQKTMAFRPGEWKWVNNPGKDLKENIFPLPVREPSQTLFNLLGTLVQSGKEVASVADIFTGKMPGQNTPASTTMATIEQGLKVFTSIYKRIYRAMGKEFTLMFELCKRHAPAEIIKIVGEVNGEKQAYGVSRFDYERAGDVLKIIPAADPNMVSETQKLLRIQGLYELVQYGTINAQEMTRQALVYQGQDNIQKLMEVPPPPEPIEITLKKMELEDAKQARQLDVMKIMSENQKRQSEIMLNMAKAKQLGDEAGVLQLEMQLEEQKAQMEMQMKVMDLMFKREEHMMDMQFKHEEHQMDMDVKQSEAQVNLAVAKATGAQDIQMNKEMNDTQLETAKKKGDMTLKQGDEKHKQALSQGEEKHKQTLKQTKEKEKVKPNGNRKGSVE
jgi:chaperonin GroES